ncbi:MAG: putative rane protein [Herbinix sp.]|jgi:uncharacterized membrane protein YsdA (DUF1294 family)|nr:putative rane protein [Herbinix sp.]
MELTFENAFLVYLLVISVVGFAMMGIDKRRAIKRQWRISERTLIITSFLGGGIGSFLGMFVFHHKTKHRKFIILLPISAIIVICFIYIILF